MLLAAEHFDQGLYDRPEHSLIGEERILSPPVGKMPVVERPLRGRLFQSESHTFSGLNASGSNGSNPLPGLGKALFYGYSFRWIRPRDDMTVDHYMERCDPIRRQLLGDAPSGGRGYSSPMPEDVPLKG